MPMPKGRPSRGKDGKLSKSARPVKIKRVKEVIFDEDARKEYLTGFSKRKKARELAARIKAIDREREDKNEHRREVRDERKERAALNVRNAAELYGDAGEPLSDLEGGYDSSDDDKPKKKKKPRHADSDDDSPFPDESAPKPKPKSSLHQESAYESVDLVTTVSIEPFSFSRSSSPVARPVTLNADGEAIYPEQDDAHAHRSSKSGINAGKKRVKNKPAARVKMTRVEKRDRATGGKRKAAGFLAGGGKAVTKGKSNKG